MNLRLNALVQLGKKLLPFKYIESLDELIDDPFYEKGKIAIENAIHYNQWFLKENIIFALKSWAEALTFENLELWLSQNELDEPKTPKKIGLILAGNIPLVGFHDILSTFVSGHIALIKLSSQDKLIMPWLISELINQDEAFRYQFEYVDRLVDYDAVIATGSNNSSHYFDFYFSKVPNIIRRNRNSVAILTGEETFEELEALSHDIFRYFGLGCRNVSKIFVPKDYSFKNFFEAIKPYEDLLYYEKYKSNYDYNKAVFLMSNMKILDNGFLTLKEDKSFSSPISSLFYSYYDNLNEVYDIIAAHKENIQCVVAKKLKENFISFGQTQSPQLWDYADGINTLDFLNKLNRD